MEKIYIVVEEKNWHNSEEYTEIISVHRTQEEAEKALKEYKEYFEECHADDLDNLRTNHPDSIDEHNDPTHYSFLDEGMGDYYEVIIKERDLD